MEFFPHRIPPRRIGLAATASNAALAFYVANVASNAVYTASFALNITGSAGPPGNDYTQVGARGPIGPTGVTGFRGGNVYLLATGWSTGSNTICYTITGIGTSEFYSVPSPPGWFCDYTTSTTYYADAATLADGVTVYTDSSCSIVANGVSLSDPVQNKAFQTNAFGLIPNGGTTNCSTTNF